MKKEQESEKISEIRKKIENSRPEYLKRLKQLVDIDSDTGNLAGSRKIYELVKPWIENLGGKLERRENENGIHLIARFSGKGNKKVLLYDHTDTVLPNQDNFHFRYDEKTDIGYGPGTSDSKGSVAFLIQLLPFLREEYVSSYKEMILYLDAEEETGSDLGDSIIEALSKEVDYAIVADGGRPGLGIVTKRKTLGKYSITIRGISGHAGNGVQSSASATIQAGYFIVALDALQSPSRENPIEYTRDALKQRGIEDHGQFVPDNTINVGVLTQTPGAKVNVIPEYVRLDLELRCFEQAEHERLEQEIFALASQPYKKGIQIVVEGKQEYKALETKGMHKKLADLYTELGESLLGKQIQHWQAGGVTPGNLIALYTPIIDGVGVDADPGLEHSIYEELYVDSYVPRALLLLEFIRKADQM